MPKKRIKSIKNNDLDFEKISCVFCGSEKYETLFKREDLNTFVKGEFSVVRCRKCGLLYLNPRPTHQTILKNIYTEEYDQYLACSEKPFLKSIMSNYGFNKRFKLISSNKKDGKLLDVGCATGDFLQYMQKKTDWQVFGLEPIPKAANIVRDRLGITVYNSFLSNTNFYGQKFDVITFWHVFEHLENPLIALRKAYDLLNDDGIIIITLPILNSIDHKLFGKYWVGFELPRHLFFFSRTNMIDILNKSGFELIKSTCLYGSHSMTMTSFKFWLLGKTRLSRKFVQRLFNLLNSFPVRLLLFPVFFIFDILQFSTPITLIAKKCKN